MSCQHNLLILFLCGVAALTVSAHSCGEQVLEGTSCSINGETRNNKKPADIRWAFTYSDGTTTEWKRPSKKKPPAGLTIEEDGSLRFEKVDQSNTGTYKYTAFNTNGQQIGTKTLELKVYAKAPKPTVRSECKPDGTVTLLCDTGKSKDLKISWYEDDKIMQDETETHLTLTSSKIKENKLFSCSVSNPASSEQSDRITVPFSAQSCGEQVLEGTSCSIKGKTTNNEKAADIRWSFTSSDGTTTEWKKPSKKKPPAGLTIEEDGSLRLESVRQNNTGTYKYTAFNVNGQQIGAKTLELKVYAKVHKPNVKTECKPDGTVTLLCDTGNSKDLKISWYEDDKIMQDEKTTHLTLTSTKIKENKLYSCSVSNPASSEQSDRITVPCCGPDSVSAQSCGEQVLEGTSCSIYGKTRNNEKPADIRWAFTYSNGMTAEWKQGSRRKPPAGLTIEEDGSLRFKSVDQSNTGTYKYTAFDGSGTQIGAETVKLTVYGSGPDQVHVCIASNPVSSEQSDSKN